MKYSIFTASLTGTVGRVLFLAALSFEFFYWKFDL